MFVTKNTKGKTGIAVPNARTIIKNILGKKEGGNARKDFN